VTCAMLMLPIIYFLLIGGVCYFVFWHATRNFAYFTSTHSIWALIFGYGAPLVAGVIWIFFMIKPLFAPLPWVGAGKVLDPEQELVLFEFVAQIVQAINAPEPRHIAVNCE